MFTSLTGNIVALLGGILVFHDPIGHTPPQIAARIAAFGLIVLGAALLRGRQRAGAPRAANTLPIPDAAIAIPQRPRAEASPGLQRCDVGAHQPIRERIDGSSRLPPPCQTRRSVPPGAARDAGLHGDRPWRRCRRPNGGAVGRLQAPRLCNARKGSSFDTAAADPAGRTSAPSPKATEARSR
jgi:hypothetical protein